MDFSGHRFEKAIILLNVRWYLSYQLSYRNLSELMSERGILVNHTNIYRWVVKFSGEIDKTIRKLKGPVSGSWRLDETYIKVQGKWRYLYRAVDKHGDTVDFLLTQKRDKTAALRFLRKAVGSSGIPESVTIDKSGSNKSALESFVEESGSQIEIRQSKYLNNMVEQDHRTVKRKMRAALGFKSFWSAKKTIAGIEAMSMIRKGQVRSEGTTTVGTFWAIFG